MKTLADLKRAMTMGTQWHLYHMGGGMQPVGTITEVNTQGVFITRGEKSSYFEFPKASCLEFEGDHTVHVYAPEVKEPGFYSPRRHIMTYTRDVEGVTPWTPAMVSLVARKGRKVEGSRQLPFAMLLDKLVNITQGIEVVFEARELLAKGERYKFKHKGLSYTVSPLVKSVERYRSCAPQVHDPLTH